MTSLRTQRRSFTMVELLAVMAIFAILISIVMTAVVAAEAFARKAHTQDMINRLSSIIMNKWNGYVTRRVPIYLDPTMPPKTLAQLKLDALHELMRLEMPDRYTDIVDGPITKYKDATGVAQTMGRPAISQAYLSRYNVANPGTNTLYQGAKCLYMIVTLGSEEGATQEFFKESDTADSNHVGLKEFVDGWGNPIRFLRWAPAFVPSKLADSALQFDDQVTDSSGNKVYKFPDPFDPFRIYGGYAIYPLIYSAGPDGITDIQVEPSSSAFHYTSVNNNPFDPSVVSTIGLPVDCQEGIISLNGSNDWYDNIHNHFNVID
jgi:prepilin-type N-terminal cleavage/methylation domain-containing protein